MTTLMPATACLVAALCAVASQGAQAFKAAGDGGFEFDTGVLRGRLRAGGKSLGLSSVVHIPTAKRLDSSNGLFSHYRVFTRGKRHGGGAWDWPSSAALRPDGAVEVMFAATPERPIEMQALYRWVDPATLDLETKVRAVSDIEAFESFLASYFSAPFTNSIVCARDAAGPSQMRFVAADKPAGDWQMFPRDDAAVGVIRDGRWQIEPNPVAWVIRPPLARPLAVRRAPATGLSAILMAAPTDCFAIATPHESEGHYSTYLSLFGRDLKAGETARARARLVILTSPNDAEIVRQYETWAESR